MYKILSQKIKGSCLTGVYVYFPIWSLTFGYGFHNMKETHKQTACLCLVQFVKAWGKTNQRLWPGKLHKAYQYHVRNVLLYSNNTMNYPSHVSPHLFTSVHLLTVTVTVAGVGLDADERASGISVVSRGYSKGWKHLKEKKEDVWTDVYVTKFFSMFLVRFVCLSDLMQDGAKPWVPWNFLPGCSMGQGRAHYTLEQAKF